MFKISRPKSFKLFRFRIFRLSLVAAFVGAGGLIFDQSFKSHAQSDQSTLSHHTNAPNCTGCAAQSEQAIYIPLTYLPEAQSGQIVFNSRSPHVVDVTPVFYTTDGTVISGDPVSINPLEIRYVNLRTLIPVRSRNRTDWGGLSLKYFGGNREMWAQFRFIGVNDGNNVDEFFVVESERRSDTLAATWWTPAGSTSVIALGNVTDTPTSADVKFGNGDTQSVSLAPRGTAIIRHPRPSQSNSDSVLITTTGPEGSIISTGVIEAANHNSNSVIRFYDTKLAKQANLYGNGLSLNNVTPHMILTNTSAAPITAVPKFIAEAGDSASPVILPPVNLAAFQTVEVDLRPLVNAAHNRSDLNVVGVEADTEGPAGSLIGALYTKEDSTGFAYDIPVRDSGPVRTMTGSYPWKADDEYSTVVYITNITDRAQEFVGQVNFDGGTYSMKPHRLAPGETAEIDMSRLRDKQKGDDLNRLIPRNIKMGQFRWAVHGVTGGKLALIGRAVMTSRSNKIMTSYSCNDPCPPYYDGWIDPNVINLLVGTSGSTTAWEESHYNNGYNIVSFGPYKQGAQWSVDDPDYTSMSLNSATDTATFTGVAPGAGTVTAFMGTFEHYTWDGLECLDDNYTYDVVGIGPVEVAPQVTISAIKAVGKTYTATVHLLVTNPESRTITLSLNPKSGATGSAQFTSNNSATRTITGTTDTDVDIKGITESSAKNTMEMTATYNPGSGAVPVATPMDFTVIKVTLSFNNMSGTIDSDNAAKNFIQGRIGRTTLATPAMNSGTQLPLELSTIVQITGKIDPSDFDQDVKFIRTYADVRLYDDQDATYPNPFVRYENCNDTSSQFLQDYNPQTGTSAGKVYDVDTPGLLFPDAEANGSKRRRRVNFLEYLSIYQPNGTSNADVRVSTDLSWSQALSIVKNGNSDFSAITDVSSNDSKVGTSPIFLNYNLTSNSGTMPTTSPCPALQSPQLP